MYRRIIYDNSELYLKMGLNLNYGKGDYYKLYKYFTQREGPEASAPEFIDLKEISGLIAYIQAEIAGETLQQDGISFVDKFNDRINEFYECAQIELAKEFENAYTDATYSMIVDYNCPEGLNFNVGISCSHPAFESIRQFIDIINSHSGKTYKSLEEYIAVYELLDMVSH